MSKRSGGESSISARRRLAAGLLAAWLLASPTGLVLAGPLADAAAPANQRPEVTTSPTGVGMVNIAAPNAAGLSYNRYQRFDVDPTGLLLNNSTAPLTAPLGITIPANANLGGRPASLIVNEVVTATPSQLNGPLAVLGTPANVVVANPNGITCNGCTFVNTSQVQLTTGSVGFRDPSGAASSFDAAAGIVLQVGSGRIIIDGAGLSAPLARLDLVAETVGIKAPVTVSGALNLLAGRQTIDAESLAVRAGGTCNDKAGIGQDWAIDATAFGALNAGSIRIVATPAGMGVRSAAQLAASSGDLRISSNGDLSLADAGASGGVRLSAAGALVNGGSIAAGANLDIAAGSVDNRGRLLVAQNGDLTLASGGTVDNSGGLISASKGLTIQAASLINAGGTVQAAGGDLGIVLGGRLENAQGTLAGSRSVTVRAGPVDNTGGKVLAYAGDLTITATGAVGNVGGFLSAANALVLLGSALANLDGAIQALNGDLRLALSGQLDNTRGTIAASRGVSIGAGSVINAAGRILAHGGTLAVTASGAIDNGGGMIGGSDAVALSGASLANDSGAVVAANGSLGVQVAGSLDNAGGTLDAARAMSVRAGSVSNAGGSIVARDGNLDLASTGALDNAGGLIAAANGATLSGISLSNANGTIQAVGGDLSADVSGALDNTGGTLSGGQGASIRAGTLMNVGGGIAAYGGNLAVTATGSVDNTDGRVAAAKGLSLQGGSLANLRGVVLASDGDLGIGLTGLLDNRGGSVSASRTVAVGAATVKNADGTIAASGGNLSLAAVGSFDNANGFVAAIGALTFQAASLSNAGGRLQSGGDLSLDLPSGSFDLSGAQTGTLAIGGAFSVRARDISNSGSFGYTGKITLRADNSLSNTGFIAAGDDLVVNVVGQCRNDGRITVGGKLTLAADNLLNLGGIAVNGLAAISLVNALENRSGARLDAAGRLDIAAGTVSNAGTLATDDAASLDVAALTNSGTLAAATTVALNATGTLTNTGTLASGGDQRLTATTLGNSGTISSGAALDLGATAFTNGGLVVSSTRLTLTSASSFSNTGTVAGGTDATFTLTGAASNAGGLLTAGNDIELSTGIGSGLGGTVVANRDLRLRFVDYSHAGGTAYLAGRDLNIAARSFINSGTLGAYRNLGITTTGALSNTGQLVAGQDASFSVAGGLTNNGTIETGRDLNISAAWLSNGTGTTQTLSFGPSLSMADYRYWVLTYITDPVVQGKLFNEITPDSQWYNSRFYLFNRWSYFRDSDLSDPLFSLWITQTTGNAKLNAGRHLIANIGGSFANNSSSVSAGGDIAITAGSFANNAAQNSYHGNVFAGGGGHDLYAYGNSGAIVQAAGTVNIAAGSSSNTGTIQGNRVYVGGSLVNGLTSYHQPTPASTLPHAVIDLSGAPTDADGVPLPAVPGAPGTAPNGLPNAPGGAGSGLAGMPSFPKAPNGSTFDPKAPTLFSSVNQLALLAPIGQDTLTNLLPAELRNNSTPFLMDAWLEQQTLRDAALRETGQATFLAGLAYDETSGLNVDSQQRLLLYQAAAKFATDNRIKLGVALSDAQQKALTSPILWYVEQSVVGPDGRTYQALVPKMYLPEGQLASMANIAGGVIKGNDVTLDAGAGDIRNTGFIAAGNRLTVNARSLVNEARSAYWGSYTQNVKGGYIEISGDRVQPGGFMSAAQMNLNAGSVSSVSGSFLEAGSDKAAQIKQQLGSKFAQTQNIDHTFVTFHEDSGAGLGQVAIMAVAIVVSIMTYGAASEAMAAAAASESAAAGAAAGAAGGAAAGGAAAGGAAAASSTWAVGGLANTVASSALAGMASSATTGLLTGNFDMGNVLRSGLSSGLTAGLTQGLGFNQMAGVKDVGAGIVQGRFLDVAKLGDALVGIAGRGVVNAAVNNALYGTSFGEGLKQSLISDAAAIGASAIGSAWGSGPNANAVMQTVAHAGLGAISAKVRGQDVMAGAIGGVTESVLGNLATFDSNDNGNRSLYTAAATLAGGLSAKALGHDALTAGQVAQNAALNNRLASQQEQDRIKALANGDPEMEKRLVAASCFKTKCSAEYPEGSAVWKQMRVLEIVGSQDNQALGLLANQTAPTSLLGGMVGTKQLFQYSAVDAILDKTSRLDNTYQIGTRTAGTVQAAAGAMTGVVGIGMVVSGGATCPETGIGCFVAAGGTALTAWSADQTKAGWNGMVSGERQPTLGGAALSQFFGVSPKAGELLYGVVGLAPAAFSAATASTATREAATYSTLARASYAEFNTRGIVANDTIMSTPEVRALANELKSANPTIAPDVLAQKVVELVASGSALPSPAIATQGSVLFKVVPTGGRIGETSEYWMSVEQARAIATMTREQVTQVLGLPAGQAAAVVKNGVSFYAMTPKVGSSPTVFVSPVAPTSQGAVANTGGLQQVIVPNRALWNDPKPVDPFTFH